MENDNNPNSGNDLAKKFQQTLIPPKTLRSGPPDAQVLLSRAKSIHTRPLNSQATSTSFFKKTATLTNQIQTHASDASNASDRLATTGPFKFKGTSQTPERPVSSANFLSPVTDLQKLANPPKPSESPEFIFDFDSPPIPPFSTNSPKPESSPLINRPFHSPMASVNLQASPRPLPSVPHTKMHQRPLPAIPTTPTAASSSLNHQHNKSPLNQSPKRTIDFIDDGSSALEVRKSDLTTTFVVTDGSPKKQKTISTQHSSRTNTISITSTFTENDSTFRPSRSPTEQQNSIDSMFASASDSIRDLFFSQSKIKDSTNRLQTIITAARTDTIIASESSNNSDDIFCTEKVDTSKKSNPHVLNVDRQIVPESRKQPHQSKTTKTATTKLTIPASRLITESISSDSVKELGVVHHAKPPFMTETKPLISSQNNTRPTQHSNHSATVTAPLIQNNRQSARSDVKPSLKLLKQQNQQPSNKSTEKAHHTSTKYEPYFSSRIIPRLDPSDREKAQELFETISSEAHRYKNWYVDVKNIWEKVVSELSTMAPDEEGREFALIHASVMETFKNMYLKFYMHLDNLRYVVCTKKLKNYPLYLERLHEGNKRMKEELDREVTRQKNRQERKLNAIGYQPTPLNEAKRLQSFEDIPSLREPQESSEANQLDEEEYDDEEDYFYHKKQKEDLHQGKKKLKDSLSKPKHQKAESDFSPGKKAERMESRLVIEELLNGTILPIEDEEASKRNTVGRSDLLSLPLRDHQKAALLWMIEKERHNKGGILGDDMGLGKTLEMVSLIISRQSKNDNLKTTLIVVPSSLINQWTEEIIRYIKPAHRPSIFVYRSSDRTKVKYADLAKYDIVIISYGILAVEYKYHFPHLYPDLKFKRNLAGRSPFFQRASYWYRIVLDEAHCIRNLNTVTSCSCSALEAKYRWCMSGTPMQNSVMDFFSLVYFLRFGPYSKKKKFRKEIAIPIETHSRGPSSRAMARLRTLILSCMIRRTKNSLFNGKPILEIPPKKIIKVQVDIDDDEKEYYGILEQKSVESVAYFAEMGIGKNMASIFALLTRLRQAVDNLKILEQAELKKYHKLLETRISDHAIEIARRLNSSAVAKIKSLSYFQCSACLEIADRDDIVILWPCGHLICEECCLLGLFSDDSFDGKKGLICPVDNCSIQVEEKNIFSYIVFRWIYLKNLSNKQILECRDSYRVMKNISKTKKKRLPEYEEPFKDSPIDLKKETSSFLIPLEEIDQQEPQTAATADSFCVTNNEVKLPLPPSILSDESKYARTGPLVGPLLSKSNEWEPVYTRGWIKSSKVVKCMEVLRGILAEKEGNKVIIFSSFLGMLSSVELALKMDLPNVSFDRYDGGVDFDERTQIIDNFQRKPRPQILLVSLMAGNTGLNLTAASNVILLDPFWNPYVEDQAMDRAHRFGQMLPVNVYRLLTPGTVEDRIAFLQERKRAVIDSALNEQEIKRFSRLSPAEIFFLFGLGEK